jgi:hypothetical protein
MRQGRGLPIAFALWLWSVPALGDGGTLRAWKQQANADVAVFTEPSPVVTGPVDISVLLLDRKTGEPIQNAKVTIDVSPTNRPGQPVHRLATRKAQANKLFQSAIFELRDVGHSEVRVRVEGPGEPVEIRFDLDVGESWTPRTGIWPWILWPIPLVVLYTIHRRLVTRAVHREPTSQTFGFVSRGSP